MASSGAKALFKGFYDRVAHPKKDQEAHPYDSGTSAIGDWILDLAAFALVALVVVTIAKWAYLAIFK
jgi:hypothetical protein